MGTKLSVPVQIGPEDHPDTCKMGTGYFPRLECPKLSVDWPPLSSTEVKERVDL